MQKQLRLRELPERVQRKITRAVWTSDRLKITDARGKGIAWIIGQDDIDNLRDCDRIARRLNKQFAQRVDEMSERIDTTAGIGRILGPRVKLALREQLHLVGCRKMRYREAFREGLCKALERDTTPTLRHTAHMEVPPLWGSFRDFGFPAPRCRAIFSRA